jgi:hypothetical protein
MKIQESCKRCRVNRDSAEAHGTVNRDSAEAHGTVNMMNFVIMTPIV